MLAASCAVAPYSGQQLDTNEVVFDGFIETAGARVRLEAFDYGTNQFTGVNWATAATTPTFAAGAICPDSPALYRYRGSARLQWPIYWRRINGEWESKVRAFKVTSSGEVALFFTANPNAGQCMAENAFNNTCTFSNVAVTCGFNINQAVVKGDETPWDNT
jgi:hypothetical protein